MIIRAQTIINGSRAATWAAITDIENAARSITGIEGIEVFERPARGLVGMRWRETRMFSGKPATGEKRITEATEGEFYTTRTETDGFVFLTTKRLSGSDGEIVYSELHDSRPQGFVATLMSIPMSLFFKGMMKKLVMQELNDIKAVVERGGNG